jgi:hypothetical protein
MLGEVRAVTVSVDYADVLSLTLPWNQQVFKSVTVVTAPRDAQTIELCRQLGVQCLQTNRFYESGAVFNKFAALEQGLDFMGRRDWLCIMDADIAFPHDIRVPHGSSWNPKPGFLYTARRRVIDPIPDAIPFDRMWRQFRYAGMNECFAGYCQIFHADDPCLGVAPWHVTNCTWAGGPDEYFANKWPENRKLRPPFDVLHLGRPFANWAGRVTPYADGSVDPEAAKRAGIFRSLLNQRTKRWSEMMKNSPPDHETIQR